MKKTFALMIAVFAVAMVFTSCTKEGQYMPTKKISEIVYTRSHKTGEVIVSTKMDDNGALTKVLAELAACGFVRLYRRCDCRLAGYAT